MSKTIAFALGPYRVDRDDNECLEIYGVQGGARLAYVDLSDNVGCASADPADDEEYNAAMVAQFNLFAASWEMYEALQAFVTQHDDEERDLCADAGVGPSPCDCPNCRLARAALTRARGESEAANA